MSDEQNTLYVERGPEHVVREFTVHSPPKSAGEIVAMIQYNDTVIVACKYAVFRLTDDDEFKPIEFIDK